MASYETLRQLDLHPEWLRPRSDLRVFLGQPGAPEATKTTVEPGNAFSPGMMTFGVTWWLRLPQSGAFFAPEAAPLADLAWSYQEGCLPVVQCHVQWNGLRVEHLLFQDGNSADFSEAVAARIRLENTNVEALDVEFFIILRSLGPAGGPLKGLITGADGRSIWDSRHDRLLLAADRPPTCAGCGIGDPTSLAQAGKCPAPVQAEDPAGWCFGVFQYDLCLEAGQSWEVALDCPQHTSGALSGELPSNACASPEAFDQRMQAYLAGWRERYANIQLDLPDDDFRHAFFAGLGHMLTAMVGEQARIAPLAYPMPWLRDSVFIIRCLDLAGFHARARAASAFIARHDFFGGFGAEGDAPGLGIWALVQHYRLTRNLEWLKEVYPAIQRKVEWLLKMRQADHPLQVCADTPVLAFTHAQRAVGVICLAGHDGIIQGAMDHQVRHSLGWVNHWAICGLREAAYAAHELNRPKEVRACLNEADDLQRALVRHAAAHPDFFNYQRTANSLLWPTRAWANYLDESRPGFDDWYARIREPGGHYLPEPYWLYFEAAQAHNALLFGQRERAWRVIDYRLRHQDLPGLYGWREGGEGVGAENAAQDTSLVPLLRGCQKMDCITPHGWSQAELWLLQRAMLVEEWQDGLLLFAGVPQSWLQPGARIAFHGLPTWYGVVSAALQIDPQGTSARVVVTGASADTPLSLHLPQGEIQTLMPAGGFEGQLAFN
jgi:hypothetical protein